MSRSLPVGLLVLGLAAAVGCGGGAATDSGAVASSGGAGAPGAAAPGGGNAAMPTGGSSGMEAPADNSMMAAPGSPEMSAEMEMYGSAAAGAGDPATEMSPEMYAASGAGSPDGAAAPGDPATDMAAMEAAYGAGGAGYPGASPEATLANNGEIPGGAGAYPGAGDPGAYPGATVGGEYPPGVDPSAPGGAGAYPGGEYPGGGGAVEEKVPEGFDGKAQLAFRRGKERDAMQYLYAHALTTDAGAESLLPTIQWVEGLRQPKLAVRWGVGFVVTAPRNFTGDPKPVGSEQKIPTRGGNRNDGAGGNEGYVGGGGGTEYGAGGGGGGGNNSLLSKGAGELGDKLAAAYTERVLRGDFGDVLKQAMERSSGGNRGNAGGPGAAEYEGAAYGAAGSGYGMTAGPESAGAGGGAAADAATQVTQIMPGLSMLGIGTQKELIDRAREDDIDAVVIIDVKLRVNTSNGLVTNESTLSLLDAKTQKKFHTTKKFNNIAIQTARADGKDDGVDKELENLFQAIDEKFKMTALPAALTAEVAAKRVAALAEEKHDNPLPVLAEARMYHTQGLLEESALHAAYEKILGVDFGRLLATGTEEDQKKVLSQWLPAS